MSVRSQTPSPGLGSRSPTPFHYGKVFRIASDANIGEFVDGNLWKYRKRGSPISSFDECDGVVVQMVDASVQVHFSPGTSPILTKEMLFQLDSPPVKGNKKPGPADKNNNHAMSNGTAGKPSRVAENGQVTNGSPMLGSPTFPSASFMTNVHRFHCNVCKTPEKCADNPTMKMACPIRQCTDPKCAAKFHDCMLEQHSKQGCRNTVVLKPNLASLAAWRRAHYEAYAAKYGSRLSLPIYTVSRDAAPEAEGGKRVYGGAFYSNRFRASSEVHLCEIGFHGPADVPQAKYTVYIEIFEPLAPEPPKALTKSSKSKSKYRLQLPAPKPIPLHVYPKGLLKERICRRRWTGVEAAQGEIFYVDLLEDDIVRGMPPIRIQAGVWYLIQFCIEGEAATKNCQRTLEQVKVTLVGKKTENEGDSIQFSFNVGSMQMPELRFALPAQEQQSKEDKPKSKPNPGPIPIASTSTSAKAKAIHSFP